MTKQYLVVEEARRVYIVTAQSEEEVYDKMAAGIYDEELDGKVYEYGPIQVRDNPEAEWVKLNSHTDEDGEAEPEDGSVAGS